MASADPYAVPDGTPSERWLAVAPHRERLIALARPRTPTPHDAEDVVHEAMLRAVEFDDLDEGRLGQFLTSVTVRLCADEHRRATQIARGAPRLAGPDLVPGPDETVCDRAEARWVARLVAALPARQREVLVARSDGMSNTEISRRYRMSYKAVESTLSRARSTARTAVAATLSLVALARRPRTAAGGVTLASMAALATIQLVVTAPAPDAEPAVRAPARAVAVHQVRDVNASRPVQPAAAPRPPASRPAPDRAQEAAAPRRYVPVTGDRVPGPIAPRTPYGMEDRPTSYTTVERLGHCLEYGIDVKQGFECKYPHASSSSRP